MRWDRKPTRTTTLALGVAALVFAASCYRGGKYDFQAFYCAGGALDAGSDPYRFGYLAHCEGKLAAIPAPLPGYDLALFALLARLPFEWANALYLGASTAAVAVAAVCLIRLTRLPATLVLPALFLADYCVSVHSGQIVSFAVASVALAALLAESRRPALAGLAVLGTLVEPHVGIGACIATALALPAARRPMALGAALLCAASAWATGWHLTLEYFGEVLPRHAASEIDHQAQLSLTHLLHLAGLSDATALLGGSLSFAATLAAGVFLGVRLSRKFEAPGFAVAVPPALSLIGGTYIHVNQMCLALPAALLAYARFPRLRPYAAVAVCLLSVPWSDLKFASGQVAGAALSVALLAFAFTGGKWVAAVCAAGATALVLRLSDAAIGRQNPGIENAFRPALLWSGFVDDEWRQLVAVEFSDHIALYTLLASLTWTALGFLAFVLVRAATAATLPAGGTLPGGYAPSAKTSPLDRDASATSAPSPDRDAPRAPKLVRTNN